MSSEKVLIRIETLGVDLSTQLKSQYQELVHLQEQNKDNQMKIDYLRGALAVLQEVKKYIEDDRKNEGVQSTFTGEAMNP